ncbi:hypothetical protein NIES806_39380 [Dolichospermum compactum NIES-806]|uniref:Uncharacterized protein n=1 Tax=Dolichospermum compactum NIES-806 TaxID=1973481 RepID=A0A1Z4V843_9CYAN|nr:hypothetical protein NIES806_39380 [Dolichospermum compactum NIES-806]
MIRDFVLDYFLISLIKRVFSSIIFMQKINVAICLILPLDEYKQSDRSLEQIRFDQAVGF